MLHRILSEKFSKPRQKHKKLQRAISWKKVYQEKKSFEIWNIGAVTGTTALFNNWTLVEVTKKVPGCILDKLTVMKAW